MRRYEDQVRHACHHLRLPRRDRAQAVDAPRRRVGGSSANQRAGGRRGRPCAKNTPPTTAAVQPADVATTRNDSGAASRRDGAGFRRRRRAAARAERPGPAATTAAASARRQVGPDHVVRKSTSRQRTRPGVAAAKPALFFRVSLASDGGFATARPSCIAGDASSRERRRPAPADQDAAQRAVRRPAGTARRVGPGDGHVGREKAHHDATSATPACARGVENVD